LVGTYRAIGKTLAQQFSGFSAALISPSAELIESVNLPVKKRYQLKNGALECVLALFDTTRPQKQADADATTGAAEAASSVLGLTAGAQMVRNRIKKNLQRIKSYISTQNLGCYRAYDADLPEYSAAIDVYADRLHIQEYRAPATIPEETAIKRLNELVRASEVAFDCPRERIHLKTRRRDKGGGKYRREAKTPSDDYFKVQEGKYQFWVNLEDYLDTGLFLDSRMLRQRVEKSSQGKRVLNLFCYTASASVYAAGGGALETVSVDLSPVYLNWAKENFELNGLVGNHRLEQADAVEYLRYSRDQFDLIYLDPPTFSNSKRTETVLDIERDHAELIALSMARLAPTGELIFVTNAQKFKLDSSLAERYIVDDFTARSIPPDFARDAKIHRAFSIKQQR
jgi:23S rRNA (guanine2445-N2)-methyltransferase / 23S rRNA (guanine2069-N7)-methyltransferase